MPPRFTFTEQFSDCLKLMKERGKNIEEIYGIMTLLIWEEPLDDICQEHRLQGDLDQFWECHIDDDWVLLYQLGEYDLSFVYTGTHSDFF